MSASRAENRRAAKAAQKVEDYKESGFRDRATYQCAVIDTPREGSDYNGRYTATELHQRAVSRRDTRKAIEKMQADQAKATAEARAERKTEAKLRARLAYLAACKKPQPVKYQHSRGRRPMTGILALAA